MPNAQPCSVCALNPLRGRRARDAHESLAFDANMIFDGDDPIVNALLQHEPQCLQPDVDLFIGIENILIADAGKHAPLRIWRSCTKKDKGMLIDYGLQAARIAMRTTMMDMHSCRDEGHTCMHAEMRDMHACREEEHDDGHVCMHMCTHACMHAHMHAYMRQQGMWHCTCYNIL